MSIKGKTESISRLVGSILILISIVLEICLGFLILNNLLISLMLVLITAPPFMLSILLKVEQDFLVKNATKFSLLLLSEIIVLGFLIPVFFSLSLAIKFYLISSSILLLITCWHTSLSLYKNIKIIFFLSSFGYFVINTLIFLNLIFLLTSLYLAKILDIKKIVKNIFKPKSNS